MKRRYKKRTFKRKRTYGRKKRFSKKRYGKNDGDVNIKIHKFEDMIYNNALDSANYTVNWCSAIAAANNYAVFS